PGGGGARDELFELVRVLARRERQPVVRTFHERIGAIEDGCFGGARRDDKAYRCAHRTQGLGPGEVGAPTETGDGDEVLRRAHRGAYGRSATGVAGDEGKRQSGQRRLVPCPFGRREDAFGEARDVVRGVRV